MMLFEIGQFFHAIHMVDDLDRADQWYDDVFGVERFYKGHLAVEKRDASLALIADLVIEPMMSSRVPGAETTPVGRFYRRFGQHLHSLSWYVTDLRGLYERMRSDGIRVTGPGGADLDGPDFPGSIYSHPKDTAGLIEFVEQPGPGTGSGDPRLEPGFSSAHWKEAKPLGIEQTSHLTAVVRDLDRAVAVYADTLGGEVIHHDTQTAAGTESVFVSIGTDSVVELARPAATDSLAGRDLAANGEIAHAITFRVADLATAEADLAARGVRIRERQGDDLVLDPDDCFGAVLRLTETALPGR